MPNSHNVIATSKSGDQNTIIASGAHTDAVDDGMYTTLIQLFWPSTNMFVKKALASTMTAPAPSPS